MRGGIPQIKELVHAPHDLEHPLHTHRGKNPYYDNRRLEPITQNSKSKCMRL